jgi:hypothetical protein
VFGTPSISGGDGAFSFSPETGDTGINDNSGVAKPAWNPLGIDAHPKAGRVARE